MVDAWRPAIILVLAGLATLPGPATARRGAVDVFPGPGAIGRAIRSAQPGDVLRIHRGRYPEVLEVDKPLTLKAVGPGRVTVDAGCEARVAINVISDGVTLRGLRVTGASEGFGPVPSEVNFAFVSRGAARGLTVVDTCDAEYGINVYDTGRVSVTGSVARGFSDAGLYVGTIDQGPVTIKGNESLGNNRGVIVEDTIAGTVLVARNDIHDNGAPGLGSPTGVWLHNSDGVVVSSNTVARSGIYGIHIDPTSGANRVFANAISLSGSLDLFDQGAGNCWNGTTYGSASPDPPPACPAG